MDTIITSTAVKENAMIEERWGDGRRVRRAYIRYMNQAVFVPSIYPIYDERAFGQRKATKDRNSCLE